jgi:hypothetical protein
MIAVLVNNAGIRLGEVNVAHECRLIFFGGANFVKINEQTDLDNGQKMAGEWFVMADTYVIRDLDVSNPRDLRDAVKRRVTDKLPDGFK